MGFWNNSEQEDPKRNFRFELMVNPSGGDKILTYAVKKVSKPSFTIQESSHKWLNHTYYYPGRLEWNTISFSIVDPGGSSDQTGVLAKFIEESGYSPASSETYTKTMSKKKSVGALGTVTIKQIDSDGNAMEKWELHNAWIKDIKFGDLDYESDDLTEITVELRYDHAVLKYGGTKGSTPPQQGLTPKKG